MMFGIDLNMSLEGFKGDFGSYQKVLDATVDFQKLLQTCCWNFLNQLNFYILV